MKIDAVELTLFAWDDIPPTKYTPGAQNLSRARATSACSASGPTPASTGNAFLGSATNPAETDAGALIRFLKPILMGKDPLAREELHAAMRARQRNMGLRTRRRLRHGAVGHRRQGRRHAALQVPGRRPLGHRRLRLEPGAGQPAGLCGGGGAVQGRRLEGLQDPSRRTLPSEDIKVCEAVRKGGRRRLHADARSRPGATATPTRCASAAPSSGWASCGTRTRSTRRTSTPTSSCARSSTSRSWPPNTQRATSAPTRCG